MKKAAYVDEIPAEKGHHPERAGRRKGGRALSRRLNDTIASAQYALTADGRLSRRTLEGFRDRYAGKRCFIIGNGPSLREMDLSALRDEYTFGLNRIYLMFEKIGFPSLVIARPSVLVGNREEHRPGEKVGIAVSKALSFALVGGLKKYKPIEARRVANAMVDALESAEGTRILEYDALIS